MFGIVDGYLRSLSGFARASALERLKVEQAGGSTQQGLGDEKAWTLLGL
jgi:hypothetical protein